MTGVPGETERLRIERACERLVLEAAHRNDTHDYEGYAALFTADGMLIRPDGSEARGRPAIRAAYASRPANRMTRHLCTNIRVEVLSAERATGLTLALVFGADASLPPPDHFGHVADGRVLLGQFEDEFERIAEGWRIARRRARFLMRLPEPGR